MEGPAFVSLLAVTPAHLLVSQEAWKRVGNGFCPRSSQPAPADRIALYRDAQMPFDADSDRDALVEETAFSTWTAVSRTTTPRVCWTYREVAPRSEEHTSELQSLMRISYAVFCLKKKKTTKTPIYKL